MTTDAEEVMLEDQEGFGAVGARPRNPVEPFFFPTVFVFAGGPKQNKFFNIGYEAAFVLTGLGAMATATTVGSGNVFESFTFRIENASTGRRLEFDDVLAATVFGTIGLPYKYPVPMLFRRTSQINLIVGSLAPGANTVTFTLHGYRLYPKKQANVVAGGASGLQ